MIHGAVKPVLPSLLWGLPGGGVFLAWYTLAFSWQRRSSWYLLPYGQSVKEQEIRNSQYYYVRNSEKLKDRSRSVCKADPGKKEGSSCSPVQFEKD